MSGSARSIHEHWAALAVVAFAMALLVAHCAYLSVPMVDDAVISLMFAKTFYAGAGLRLNLVSQVIEGFSNPLWTLLIGLAYPLHLDPLRFTQVLGVGFAALSVPAFAHWGPAARGGALRLEDAAGGLVAALVTPFAYWSATGMETGLHAFLLGLLGATVLRELRTGRGSATAVVAFLLCQTRPEGALYVFAAAALWLAVRARERRAPGRQELRIAVVLAGLLAAVELGRWLYFASWLPNTYYAKRLADFQRVEYLKGFATAHWALCAGAVLGLFGGRRGWLAALFAAMGVLFVWTFKGDWMREWRFLAPLVPVLGAGLAAALGALRERWGPVPAVALLVPILALQGSSAHERSPQLKRGPELPYTQIAAIVRSVVPRIHEVGMRRPLIAFPDVGGLSLTLPTAEIVDTGALADYAVARHSGNYPAIEDYLLSEGLPAFIDAHGPSGYVGSFSRLMENYVPMTGLPVPFISVLRGLTAQEDPRCPGGKAAVLALSPDALSGRLQERLREGQPEEALRLWRCAWTYQPEERLPGREQRRGWMALAEQQAEGAPPERALRNLSFAAVVSGGEAHLRRRVEALRAALFPDPAAAPVRVRPQGRRSPGSRPRPTPGIGRG